MGVKRIYVAQSEHHSLPDAVADETIPYGGEETTLQEVVRDIRESHRELDKYRKGAIVLSQELKEAAIEAQENGNLELAAYLFALQDKAWRMHERIEE